MNSYAIVFVDGKKAGEIRFPAGEVDLTALCRPGKTYVLSLLVVAMPLKGVLLSYTDTNSAREVKGTVERRGLCGDVYLVGTPSAARIGDVKIDTSVRKGEITVSAALEGLAADASYALRVEIRDGDRVVRQFTSKPFKAGDLEDGRIAFAEKWKPEKLWDVNTPQNIFTAQVSLLGPQDKLLDAALPVRFGFREFWIDGRDFYLNGTRIFLSAVPLDNAQIGARSATYEAARETMKRLKSFGINFVYTHNYGCEPGSHLSFAEILRAADDVGMLVAFSQPHFAHYDWKAADADRTNGYARHAEFYVRAGPEPSVGRRLQHEPQRDRLRRGHEPRPDRRPQRPAHRLVEPEQRQARAAGGSHREAVRPGPHRLSPLVGQPRLDAHDATSIPTSPRSRSCPTGSSTGPTRASSRSSLASTACRSPGTGPCTAAGTRANGNAAAPGSVGVLPCRVERPVPRRPGLPDQRDGEEGPALGGQAVPGRQALASLGLPVCRRIDRFRRPADGPRAYITDNWRAFRTWGVSAIRRGNTSHSGSCATAWTGDARS